MKPGARWVALIACAALVVALAAARIAYTLARTFQLRTANGQPISDAYVGYYHASSIFNFVDSLSRCHPGKLIVPDANGGVRIAARLGLERPLDSSPRARVKFIYVPALHNALQVGPNGSSLPGVVEIAPRHRSMILNDVSADPDLWHGSLRNLHSVVRFDLWSDPSGGTSRYAIATRDEIDPLVGAVEREYLAMHQRYQTQPRALPWG